MSHRRTFAGWLALAGLGAGGLLLVPDAAAQVSAQDAVTGAGTAEFHDFSIDARSGPNGEAASGSAYFANAIESFSGPVTCLAVTGNVAVFNIDDVDDGVVAVQVTDGSATGGEDLVILAPGTGRSPDDCSPALSQEQRVVGGDIAVTDATSSGSVSKERCKRGGWRTLTDAQGRPFPNQGRCTAAAIRS